MNDQPILIEKIIELYPLLLKIIFVYRVGVMLRVRRINFLKELMCQNFVWK
ncbi:MAG: hypothetical protein RIS64_95 [Bacteroidota bacterium]|jgi:hypothetical protein